jgi:hypothetical protein
MNRARTTMLLFLHNRFYQRLITSGASWPAALTFSRLQPLIQNA